MLNVLFFAYLQHSLIEFSMFGSLQISGIPLYLWPKFGIVSFVEQKTLLFSRRLSPPQSKKMPRGPQER